MKSSALEEAYRIYYHPLLLYAFSLTGDKAVAEDLVSTTFLKAFLSYEHGSLRAWLFTVLKHEFYNHYKKNRRLVGEEHFDFNRVQASYDILKSIIKEEEKRWLYERIYQLPQRDKEIMLLSLQGLKDDEIANIQHLTIENIRVIKYRVKQKLIQMNKEETQ